MAKRRKKRKVKFQRPPQTQAAPPGASAEPKPASAASKPDSKPPTPDSRLRTPDSRSQTPHSQPQSLLGVRRDLFRILLYGGGAVALLTLLAVLEQAGALKLG